MRPAHFTPRLRLAQACSRITLAASLAALAAPALAANASVLDAAAPSAPLLHQPLPPSGAIATEAGDWKAANAAVGHFPRGHADVVQWEKAQAQATDPGAAAPAPAAPHQHQHQRHQPAHGSMPMPMPMPGAAAMPAPMPHSHGGQP